MTRHTIRRYVPDRPADLDRADGILAGIPALFIATYLSSAQIFTSHLLITGIAAITATALVVDCLFLNPPTNEAG